METAIPVITMTYSVLLTVVITGSLYRAVVKHCARRGCPMCTIRLGGEVRVKISTDGDRARFVRWLNAEPVATTT